MSDTLLLTALVGILGLFAVTVTRDPDREPKKGRILGLALLVFVHLMHQIGVVTLFATIIWSIVSLVLIIRTFAKVRT